MGEPGDDTTTQLSSGVSVTIVKVMCGSPTGMGQLIKYFESQSRRLDRQTIQPTSLSLNPHFESAIKFNGVPILPPAITPSRREELRQLKKDAVLLEKRLKARQRRELMEKADSLINKSQVYFPDTSSRQTARQLNFNPDGHDESLDMFSYLNDRTGVEDLCSTLSAADTGNDIEDFGLHTMDSVTSEFMSLDCESIPRVFSGLALTSVKEQKISYDLDRLSKALNVQDLASTSGSDFSDGLDFTPPHERKDLPVGKHEEDHQSIQNIKDTNLSQTTSEHNDDSTISSFHDSKNVGVRDSDISGIFNTRTTNLDQTQVSLNNSSGCAFSKTTTTTEGISSNRSSPKSLKSGVHFASFVTEYINSSASQSHEYQTVVKKKMPTDLSVTNPEHDIDVVLPIIGDPAESRRKSLLTRKVSDCENDSHLLDNVSFCVDSDSSPVTHLFTKMPFQNYGKSEAYSSDKENDVSQLYKNFTQGHKRSLELGSKFKYDSNDIGSTESPSSANNTIKTTGEEKKKGPFLGKNLPNFENLQVDSLPLDRGVELNQGVSSLTASSCVGNSHSVSGTESITLKGAATVGTTSALHSQGSVRSSMLTSTSESSGSTIRMEFSEDRSAVAMNITDTHLHCISKKTDQRQERLEAGSRNEDNEDHKLDSPKKLNTDASIKESDTEDKCVTPSQTNICRNSYTLSEPSPALIKALGKPKTEKKEKNNEQKTSTVPDNSISTEKQQNVGIQKCSPKRAQPTYVKNTVESPLKMSVPLGAETEGKAEHINKYLNQVHFQNSMNLSAQSWDTHHVSAEDTVEGMEEHDESSRPLTQASVDHDCQLSVLDVLSRSVAESQGSLEHLTIEELLELHHQKMAERRQMLIKQQQRDMEELFVQQRREVMLLEAEIKAAQKREREQQKFLTENAPENVKVKSRNRVSEYSPANTGNFENADVKDWQQKPVADIILDNLQPQSVQQLPSGSQSSTAGLKLQQKTYPGMDAMSDKQEQVKAKPHLQPKKDSLRYPSPGSTNVDNQTQVKTTAGDNHYSRSVSNKTAAGNTNRIPENSPSVASPHLRRPVVVRSPLKSASLYKHYRVIVPPEAYLPEMQVKFNKLTAAAKGFLTRCLLKSDKVQELVKTIRDTREFAFSFQTETPIKKGMFTSQDRVLLERIVAQLQAAVLDIHEIFFEISVSERMTLIQQTRLSEQEKRAKASSRDSMRESGPKISQATLKALERKRKSREAETSAVITTSRSRTVPPRTSSPQHSNHIESRALKPLQGDTQISPIKPETNRIEKASPDTAKEKQLTQPKRITNFSNKSVSIQVKSTSDTQKKGSVKLSAVANKPMMRSKHETNKPSSRPTKSWR